VLRNRLGITDPDELAQAEADFTVVRLAQLHRQPLARGFDLAHLCALHQRIFGDVYPWAGQLRTVSIAKESLFCLPQHLESFAGQVFGRLAERDLLRGLERDPFIAALTEFLSDLNALHPFREGNGRTQRQLCRQLARQAGHELRWALMDPDENIVASRAALHGDNMPLRRMLATLVDRPDHSSTAPRPRPPAEA
jgi:cell filamentation protein